MKDKQLTRLGIVGKMIRKLSRLLVALMLSTVFGGNMLTAKAQNKRAERNQKTRRLAKDKIYSKLIKAYNKKLGINPFDKEQVDTLNDRDLFSFTCHLGDDLMKLVNSKNKSLTKQNLIGEIKDMGLFAVEKIQQRTQERGFNAEMKCPSKEA